MSSPNIDDFIRVNGPRVDKILAMLELIAKSSNSYRVSTDETNDLMRPIAEWAQRIDTRQTLDQLDPPENPAQGSTPRPAEGLQHWSDFIHMARTAPISVCMDAMMVIATRVQEEKS